MLDGNGYDERLFRLLLAEYVRHSFSAEARQKMPDVRVSIATRYDQDDAESDYHSSQSIIVIHGGPLCPPLGPGNPEQTIRVAGKIRPREVG